MRLAALSVMAAIALATTPMLVRAADSATDTKASGLEGLSSTKDHGVIKIAPDPALADGRLVLKVVAFNRDRKSPASFGPDNVKVFTAAGEAVPLIPLDQLIAQARGSKDGRGDKVVDVYGTQGPTAPRDISGKMDVSNYTGGNNSMPSNMNLSSRERRPEASAADKVKVDQQIADLRAAILQPVNVAPASAAGGQVVTQKIKFGRKDEHALRVVVDFNGEQHEFNFAAPPAH